MKIILKNKFFAIPIFGFLFLLLVLNCKNLAGLGLKNGDLLFVTAKQAGLSGAINNVTQKQKDASFDHIGIIQKDKSGTFVLHAAPTGGSQKQNLNSFLKDQANNGHKVVVYRLKSQFQNVIPNAVENANYMIGKPYNFNYILDENAYYCSDFIERAFRRDHIFTLEPMTFIDPKTGKTNEFWEEFYKKKNLKVPEGELGCNPNGLAASDKLERIKEF